MSFYFPKDKQRKAALIAELKARGLKIPQELLDGTKRYLKWPTDDNGYFPRKDGKHYTPHSQQKLFVDTDAVFSIFRGGRGSGKTAAGAQKALKKIMQGESGAVLNPDFENLKTSTWPELQEWIPWDLVIQKHQYRKEVSYQPQQPFRLVFKNNAFMLVKGLKDPNSARGPNINWLWYDEAGRDMTGMSWKIALPSVRVGNNIQLWATTTPNYESPWIEDFFINKNIPEDALEMFGTLGEDRELVEEYHGSIFDNKDNLNPVFMTSILSSYPSGFLRQQEVYGEFVRPEGSLGDRSWFEGMYLITVPEVVKKRIRFWDVAGTEKKWLKGKEVNDPDESVGTLISMINKQEFVIERQDSGFLEWDGLLRLIRDTAMRDGPEVKLYIEQEPGSGGKNQVAAIDKYLKEQLPGHFGCKGWQPPSDRVELANLWFAEAAQKRIFIVKDGTWDVEGMLKQLDVFPSKSKHDDRITSITGARMNIASMTQWKHIPFMSLTQPKTDETNAPDGRRLLLL